MRRQQESQLCVHVCVIALHAWASDNSHWARRSRWKGRLACIKGFIFPQIGWQSDSEWWAAAGEGVCDREAVLGKRGCGVEWTRTPHPTHEQGGLVLSHCDTDNTVFTPGLQPRGRGDFIIQTAAGWWGYRGWWVCFQLCLIEVLQKAALPLWDQTDANSPDRQERILFAHIFITMREPGEQSGGLFICRETDSNYCRVWKARRPGQIASSISEKVQKF